MDDDGDWGLHAVVRGYASAASTAAAASPDTTSGPSVQGFSPPAPDQDLVHFLTDRAGTDGPFQGLREVYLEVGGVAPPPVSSTDAEGAAVTAAGNVFHPSYEIMQMRLPPPMVMNNVQSQENVQFSNPGFVTSSSHNFPPANFPPPIRQRRRKNQQMKVVRRMTQEELSADSWAWRKYGQKPIKGSPFPRNYYRCSTSKGCAARKQVERSPNDPGIFVVSYTGEHTHPRPSHRSSLAGSTRNKLSSPPLAAAKNDCKLSSYQHRGMNISSSSSSPASFSRGIPLVDGGAAAENDDLPDEKEAGGGGNAGESMDIFLTNPNDQLCADEDHEDVFRGFLDSDDHSSGAGGDLFSGGLLSSPPWTPTSSATFHGGHQ